MRARALLKLQRYCNMECCESTQFITKFAEKVGTAPKTTISRLTCFPNMLYHLIDSFSIFESLTGVEPA